MRIIERVKIGLIFLLVFLMVFSYHPGIFTLVQDGGSTLVQPIWYLFTAITLLSLSLSILQSKQIIWYFVLLTLFALTLFLVHAMGFPISRDYIRILLIPFCALIIGWQLKISKKTYKALIVFFGCVVLYVAASQIYTNIGAFVIESQYLVQGKNALGVIVATSVVAFIVLFLQKENNKLFNVFCLALAILAFVLLLTMRARAAMLMTLLIVVFVIYKNFVRSGNKYFFLSVVLTIFSLLAIYIVLPEAAKTYILDSFFYAREDDIISGRGERNRMAIEFLQDNLFFGNIRDLVYVPWIHNFPLLLAYNFGIIAGFGAIAIYFYLSVVIIKAMLKYDIFEIKNIGFVLIAVAFGIGMAEPMAPFGPGTVFVFSFITFGIALRHNYKPKENSAHK